MNHYPAIDVLGSISRLFPEITDPEHQRAAAKMRTLLAMYRENKDLIDVGMYQKGTNPRLDAAINLMPEINKFLQQSIKDSVNMNHTIETLKNLMNDVEI
jgi:flagellum-specific ATP synthase